jgi:hypothetical protein
MASLEQPDHQHFDVPMLGREDEAQLIAQNVKALLVAAGVSVNLEIICPVEAGLVDDGAFQAVFEQAAITGQSNTPRQMEFGLRIHF